MYPDSLNGSNGEFLSSESANLASLSSLSSLSLESDHEMSYDLSLQPYNSMATQLNLTRFEYRLLRFFDDSCIPLFILNANPSVQTLWRTQLPRYFASVDVVRQSVFAFACLNLWPHVDLLAILDLELRHGIYQPDDSDFSHVFQSLSVFEDSSDNIFTRTAEYFSRTVQLTHVHMGKYLQADENLLGAIFFSSSLIYAFLGFHPHRIVPVADFDNDPPADLLGFSASLRPIFDKSMVFFFRTVPRLAVDISNIKSTKDGVRSCLVADLRMQLSEYYALKPFATITAQTSLENEVFSHFLLVFDTSFNMAVKRGYPVPLFRVLFTVKGEFAGLVRLKHPFALRLLFVYCCICYFCGFSLLREQNIWRDYINYHVEHFGLCVFDQTLLDCVMARDEVDFTRFSADFMEFDQEVTQLALHLRNEGEVW